MNNNANIMAAMAVTPIAANKQAKPNSWYEVMAEAWGKTLDAKASEIESAAAELTGGNDQPSHITQMTALAQQMGFMSNSAHTSLQSVGTALETVARKQ
ncbi:hypothetical protein FVQ98_17650 [Ottowia sp. GY511]|uniref:Serine kinase n=1 Tax=Ottowia flava TaxID=2675430 RepID=A0ABW4KXK3_9BURK|nr:hypothetical protein [Ottowia sp. GY511]TXK23282.1 hypothetical protein FVQ98_17650 [Ottowia sp. GY511]